MAEQEVKRVDTETPVFPAPVESKSEVVDEKAIVPPPPAAEEEEKVADGSKDLAVAEKTEPGLTPKKISGGSMDRDVARADLEKEKRLSFVKAWEDSERTKAENKSQKKLSAVVAWENSKKAALEATLRKMEEKLEKERAEYAEKMRNKVALIHKEAEEKRAMVESKRGEEFLKAEEMAAKYRATGQTPKKLLGFF
ncbi:CARBOXY-TERMINAL REGION REMORIN [Salix viminalis]|uniref:CARBOXY-TERMINAL REGION REMORIN n=1 Tax=Salix viminalis TaxID=40686 RepID=A0A9Q0NT21_SALVM|nr:CARBOXY-TERMINAL REGION REMORIN [Salix viminalis]